MIITQYDFKSNHYGPHDLFLWLGYLYFFFYSVLMYSYYYIIIDRDGRWTSWGISIARPTRIDIIAKNHHSIWPVCIISFLVTVIFHSLYIRHALIETSILIRQKNASKNAKVENKFEKKTYKINITYIFFFFRCILNIFFIGLFTNVL